MPLTVFDVLVALIKTIGDINAANHDTEIANVAMLAVLAMAKTLVELNEEGIG